MHFSNFAIAALAALPSIASALTLYDISPDIGDAKDKCASQYSIPLMSCNRLPGTCAEACQQQLENLQKTLQSACQGTKNVGNGLLAAALNGKLVDELCLGSQPAVTRAPSASASPTFMVAPGKSFSGSVIQVSSVSAVAAVSSAGLIIDTSVPMSTGAQSAGAFPTPTYAPTTLATSSSAKPASTSAGGSGNSNTNGSPFSSQPEDAPSSGATVRAGAFGVVIGVVAVIANVL
ncbi:hypothetical protein TWF696_008958 [Orbilia brochopaga]|uniref:Uncharacterized protein n=1 Tax=Orbilia brochopaga TaxID=3140254 RepID=A0AAV9UHE9_9PEZI